MLDTFATPIQLRYKKESSFSTWLSLIISYISYIFYVFCLIYFIVKQFNSSFNVSITNELLEEVDYNLTNDDFTFSIRMMDNYQIIDEKYFSPKAYYLQWNIEIDDYDRHEIGMSKCTDVYPNGDFHNSFKKGRYCLNKFTNGESLQYQAAYSFTPYFSLIKIHIGKCQNHTIKNETCATEDEFKNINAPYLEYELKYFVDGSNSKNIYAFNGVQSLKKQKFTTG
jgi:hypothetical protein